ncbi:hypothetical protein [Microbacterium gorillae]|uniref:hypothetical protein n=1 Tax=Microbacterium gorillae TaxID=1231063 RepID=UPI003D9799F6
MRRPIRHALAISALLLGMALTGCGAQATASTAAPTSTTSTMDASSGALLDVPTPSATPVVTFDLLVDTETKTVLGLDCDSLAALTGVESVPGEEDTVAAVLTDPKTWQAHDATTAYADAIAEAAMTETQPIRAALTNMSTDDTAILKLIITHTPAVTEVHLGVGTAP